MAENALVWGATATTGDRLWGAVAHLSVFVGLPVLGPILLYIIAGRKVFIRYHAIQAIALHLALVLLGVVGWFTCGMGWLLGALGLVAPLYGAFNAGSGVWSGYPLLSGFGKE